jgi:serine/threonine protein kinase
MASRGSGTQLQSCPQCGQSVETTGLEPFARVDCPACATQLRVERVFETYVVVEPLGTGGMGSVFKARDTRLNRFVALKLLRREFADDATFTAKLQEEARITAAIKHPHVVEVFAVGEDHGQFYVVMELVDGGSLDNRIEDEKRLSELETIELGIQVAKGLEAALDAGLIHRDIKPGNILFADRQTAKIVDFGLAMLAAQHAEAEGEIWGTPYYVAPERLIGAKEDFRSDLYSLGATLFHAVAGRPTFAEETQSAAELKKLKSNPIGLKEVAPAVSDETAAVINQMLRPEPTDRQSSYRELITQLEAAHGLYLAREEELRGRWSWPKRILVSLGTILLISGLVFGIVFGARSYSEKKERETRLAQLAQEETGRAALANARQELEAGHYATAEPLFRDLALTKPGLAPVADLCAAMQMWERGQFAQAAAIFARFVRLEPAPALKWIEKMKPLAQDRLSDYQRFTGWQKTRSATRDPAVALTNLRDLEKKLKAKGALMFLLADEEAKLADQVTEVAEKRAAEEKKLAAEEAPRLANAIAAAKKAGAVYRFAQAVTILESAKITAPSLEAEYEKELQRARWLADWKEKLIRDLNTTGYGGVVTDIHGVRYDGPVRRATPDKIELKTRYGSVLTDWLNLSPEMLLKISTAFIRPGASDMPERQWLSAIFAAQTGQAKAADELAAKAASGETRFRELRARYFPEAK